MRRLVVGLFLLTSGLGASLLSPPNAAALSCERIARGDIEFVGTVVSVTNRWDDLPDNQGTWARFAVEEVWRNPGEPLGSRLEVRGGPKLEPRGGQQVFVAGFGETTFELGQRYLVGADRGSVTPAADPFDFYWETPAGVLAVMPCAAKPQLWSDTLSERRPADAVVVAQTNPIGPEPWPDADDSSRPYVAIVTAIIVVAGGCLYLLLRRGSIAYRARQDDAAGDAVTPTE